ncbi:MAG: lauroyl acyltransferase [Bacteroidetes bacterium HGW-Bacteroidetes-10]|nr:MAG: lauroyl acyltransferase [Bacteroidetes bacterium HGW-Bacteroidetes-10]
MLVYAIGFLAQLFFGARTVLQWILSERAKKSLSPSIFWILSIVASWLFFIYGWMREDFAIILGQVIAYYIYIWNLNAKSVWKKVPFLIRAILVITPPVAIFFASGDASEFAATFLRNENIPLWMLIMGSAGQVIFTLRFVYQLIYSVKKGESVLPLGFWIISLSGSSIIIIYALLRMDPVLILGQSFGFIAYIRNIVLHKKHNEQISQPNS